MKRLFTILVVVVAVVSAASMMSCRQAESYKFLHQHDEIAFFSIITVVFDEEGILTHNDQVRIDDVDTFMIEFSNVDCYTYWGDPIGISEECNGSNALKVTYTNGDYELINWNGQAEYTCSRGFRNYVGYSVFDEQQFNELIEKYLTKEKLINTISE